MYIEQAVKSINKNYEIATKLYKVVDGEVTPMFTWAIPELALITADRPGSTDCPFQLAAVQWELVNSATVALFKFAASQAPKRMQAKLQGRPAVAGMPVPQPTRRSQPAAQVAWVAGCRAQEGAQC